MNNTTLNQKIKNHLALVEQKKALEKELSKSKALLMGFDGIKTDKFSIFVATSEVERVVGKEDLFEKFGEKEARRLDLLRTTESKSLKINPR